MSLPDIFGQLEVGGFFRFGLTGDAEEVLGFGNDEKVGVFVKDFNSRGQTSFWGGESIGSNRDRISDGYGMIELGNRAAIDGDGLKLEPGSDLFFLLVGPGAEHLFEQWARVGGDERLGHRVILAEKSLQGNVWRLVEKGRRGRVLE